MSFEFQRRAIDIDAILEPRVAIEATPETESAVADIQETVAAIRITPPPAAVASLDAELKAEVDQ